MKAIRESFLAIERLWCVRERSRQSAIPKTAVSAASTKSMGISVGFLSNEKMSKVERMNAK